MPGSLRRWATTLAVALGVATIVAGAGYGLERTVLRAPTQGEREAAAVQGFIGQYRFVASEIHVAGHPTLKGECLSEWQQGRNGRPAGRGARVLFSSGERLIVGDRRIARIQASPRPLGLAPVAEVELAGCTRNISDHIASHLIGGRRASAVATSFLGRPVMKVHARTLRTWFDLFVVKSDGRYRPVGIRVSTRAGIAGWSRLTVVPLTPVRRREFRVRFHG